MKLEGGKCTCCCSIHMQILHNLIIHTRLSLLTKIIYTCARLYQWKSSNNQSNPKLENDKTFLYVHI